ncbi:MAG TPA: DUF2752 domain-containing protein [Verrucomicrobiae bacterium]|jgi:hypothetical protein
MNAVPPKISRSVSANGWFAGIILGAVAAGIGAVVFFFNPTTHPFYPVCQFHQLTGLNCPGCGATRAFYALLHGNFATALRDNALFIFAMVMAVIYGVHVLVKKLSKQPVRVGWPAKWLWPVLALAFVFTVLRNLPAFSFLSPA